MVLAQPGATAVYLADPAHGRPNFAAYPATPFGELDFETIRAFSEVPDNLCSAEIDVLIDAYIRQYPHFHGGRDDAGWRQAWLEDVGLATYPAEVGCHFADPILDRLYPFPIDWIDLFSGLPVWCGRWSEREIDPELRRIVAEMIPLVMRHGVPRLVDTMIGATQQHREIGIDAFFALNPDVALYLVERRGQLLADGVAVRAYAFDDPDTHDGLYLNSLTPERRAEVMAAADTGDYQSILDTTADCMPREAFLKSVGAQ